MLKLLSLKFYYYKLNRNYNRAAVKFNMTVSKQQTSDHAPNLSPDEIIDDIGGCGPFQIRMSIVAHIIKTIVCFSFAGMIIYTAPPSWWCENDLVHYNLTSCYSTENGSSLNYCESHSCYTANGTQCTSYGFENSLNTIVNEFNLVCAQDFIPSTINSVQLAGILCGNLMSGQISDLFGRKPPMFASIVIIMVSNLLGFFSTCWEMFAVAVFFTGVGGGFFLTTHYCLLSEFSPAKWRVWITGFPSWPIEGCFLSLVSWLLHDWRYIQLFTAIFALPCLLSWFIIPESFRWYVAHDKPEKAEEILRYVAKFNKHEDINLHRALRKPETRDNKRYTVLDLVKTKTLIRVTLLSALSWIALGFCSFGLAFGIQSLSGNIHLNLFLFSLTGIPSKAIALWLQNR
ncbi:solute carrier family 22 member 4-like isoform X1 [Mercenaria mercenaria]|uniref:solute carrier family 22 member 4-like isoform X1 n=2 Tax=Mercenaria mercenaria TaxID=6596 RepID=UPI00234E6AAA|nr:solute carrier family 22 member 4-like isoform X1 [Mercenaria mercenaria]